MISSFLLKILTEVAGVIILGKAGTRRATQLMNRYGGKEWQEWRSAMEAKLTGSQDKEGPTAGSWFSAEDAWNQQLGRLGLTSLCLMTLEVGQEQQR
ncbi:MAG: hypothetical protein ACYC6N_06510 [Pirellulaceae bacterium]